MGAKDRRRWPRYGRGGQRAAKAAAGGGAATKEEPSPAEAALAGGKPGEFGPSPAAVRFPDGEREPSGRPRRSSAATCRTRTWRPLSVPQQVPR